jgi:hypothetical protein
MANPDIPRGFEPVGSTSGSDYCGKTQAYAIAAADTVAVGIGDLVKRTGEMVTIDGQTYPVVAQAAAGATLLEGGVVGFSPDADSFSTFRTAGAKSAPRICYLSADPYIEYEAQADGNIPDASAGLNANIIVGVPDSVTGQSIMEIDSGTTTAPAATATLQVRLVRRSRVVNNESGANALWVVRINNQATRSTTGL